MNAPFLRSAEKTQAWTAHEAFLGILTLVAVWDGQKAASRLAVVHAFAKRSPFLLSQGAARLIELQETVVRRIGASHGEALGLACSALPPEMGASVYAQCLEILSSTGAWSECDRAIVEDVRSLLNVDSALAKQIEAVIFLKNRY